MPPTTFHYRIDGGDEAEQTIEVASSLYLVAAAAILGRVSNEQIYAGVRIEVWYPPVLPDYPGHTFWACFNDYGNVEIGILTIKL